jgi:hypothetical protein
LLIIAVLLLLRRSEGVGFAEGCLENRVNAQHHAVDKAKGSRVVERGSTIKRDMYTRNKLSPPLQYQCD